MDDKYFFDFLIKAQAIAKTGLKYSTDPYALTNYQELNELSKKYLEDFENVKFDRPNYFQKDIYPTPNISVRTVIFNKDQTKVLLVREASLGEYSLPGGWCDLYDSPSAAAKNECKQEAGADVEIVRLVGLVDLTPLKDRPISPQYCVIFLGKLIGELHEHEYETDDVGFFDINNPPVLSRKTSRKEFDLFVKAALNGETLFN